MVGVYVEDLLVTGTEQIAVDSLFTEMACLSIKGLGREQDLKLCIKLDESKGFILDQQVTIELLMKAL